MAGFAIIRAITKRHSERAVTRLHFDVARVFDVLLDEHAAVAKRGLRLVRRA